MKHSVFALAVLSAMAAPAFAQSMEITVAPGGTISEAGAQAVLSGTIQCPAGYSGYNSANLVQVQKGAKPLPAMVRLGTLTAPALSRLGD